MPKSTRTVRPKDVVARKPKPRTPAKRRRKATFTSADWYGAAMASVAVKSTQREA